MQSVLGPSPECLGLNLKPTGLPACGYNRILKAKNIIRRAYKHTNDAGSYILVFLSTLTVFFRSRKKNNVKDRKKRPHSPPASQLIFSLRLIKGKLSPRWVLIWAFRVFSLGVFSCDWWKAQTKAKCNSCALDSEHLSNPTIPSDRAIVRERKNKSGKKILFHAMEGTSSGGYYREFCSKWNWCKKYFNQ